MSGTSVASEHAAPHILENVMGETSRRLDVVQKSDHTCTGILPNFSVIVIREEVVHPAGGVLLRWTRGCWVSVPW